METARNLVLGRKVGQTRSWRNPWGGRGVTGRGLKLFLSRVEWAGKGARRNLLLFLCLGLGAPFGFLSLVDFHSRIFDFFHEGQELGFHGFDALGIFGFPGEIVSFEEIFVDAVELKLVGGSDMFDFFLGCFVGRGEGFPFGPRHGEELPFGVEVVPDVFLFTVGTPDELPVVADDGALPGRVNVAEVNEVAVCVAFVFENGTKADAVEFGIFSSGEIDEGGNDVAVLTKSLGAAVPYLSGPADEAEAAVAVFVNAPLGAGHGDSLLAEKDNYRVVGDTKIVEQGQ